MTAYSRLKKSILTKIRNELGNESKRKDNIVVYKFIGCSEYLFRTLINGEIRLAPPSFFNDPFDCPVELLLGTKEYSRKAIYKVYKECLRVTCFTLPNNDNNREEDVLFWSHYADSHRGICIKYEINCDKLPNEEFSFSCLLDIDYNTSDFFSINEDECYRKVFSAKANCWKEESELRLIYFDCNASSGYHPIKIPGRITDIYFGLKCNSEHEKTIMKVLELNKDQDWASNVRFYKMCIDENVFGHIQAMEYDSSGNFRQSNHLPTSKTI